MDEAFTGFSEETCKQLGEEHFNRIQSQNPEMENIEPVIRAEDWKDKRENASILDLKSLTSLRVVFDLESSQRAQDPIPAVLLSCVAGLYAFKMCEKLKVSIGVFPSLKEYYTSMDYDVVSEDGIILLTNCLEETMGKLARSLDSVRPYVTMDSSLD